MLLFLMCAYIYLLSTIYRVDDRDVSHLNDTPEGKAPKPRTLKPKLVIL